MGIFRRPRFNVPFGFALRRANPTSIHVHFRSDGERRALALCCLAATISVVVAIGWPNWATVHGAVILCGLSLVLFLAPWLDGSDSVPQPKFEQQDREMTTGQSEQVANLRRAA